MDDATLQRVVNLNQQFSRMNATETFSPVLETMDNTTQPSGRQQESATAAAAAQPQQQQLPPPLEPGKLRNQSREYGGEADFKVQGKR